ncbi:hypothetical protein CYY_002528 [Polysphondylium violaceum]|uniref:Iron hydrogenase small subunit domain-containing protein n=1 Tax=Polysphondylium violaceum TaxID=133409 RepID=A0A8J4PZ83_9MYCE|nr:hypothetical protein CYY_002528 [Polysphondylium violaceum]
MSGEDKFSSILKLTDLDYINPSQICIKPVEIEKTKPNGTSKIKIENDGSYVEVSEDGTEKTLEKATITLNDCLACSGCITSAESVLITAQSVQEFLTNINGTKTIVVTLSPQSRASLSNHFKLSPISVYKKLSTFFNQLGINYLFDSSFSRDFSLLESANEFVARYKKTIDLPLPMLASACPGWICYAEKTHGDYILPYISTTKSPQQIMGTLVKYYFSEKINKKPSDIYHVTIMPCYDKKLEASRNDFYSDIFNTKDVDCVLSTSEILDLFKDKEIDFNNLAETEIRDETFLNYDRANDKFIGVQGSSGGYLEFIYKYAAKELFNLDIQNKDIEYKVGRNSDFKETSLMVNGEKIFTFALAYGFRNIQNIVRKIKISTSTNKHCGYDFVEVMACPSGCINGGGQIKSEGGIKDNKAFTQDSENYYNDQLMRDPQNNLVVKEIYNSWLNGYFSQDSNTKLHTEYHRIEKSTNALNIKW